MATLIKVQWNLKCSSLAELATVQVLNSQHVAFGFHMGQTCLANVSIITESSLGPRCSTVPLADSEDSEEQPGMWTRSTSQLPKGHSGIHQWILLFQKLMKIMPYREAALKPIQHYFSWLSARVLSAWCGSLPIWSHQRLWLAAANDSD